MLSYWSPLSLRMVPSLNIPLCLTCSCHPWREIRSCTPSFQTITSPPFPNAHPALSWRSLWERSWNAEAHHAEWDQPRNSSLKNSLFFWQRQVFLDYITTSGLAVFLLPLSYKRCFEWEVSRQHIWVSVWWATAGPRLLHRVPSQTPPYGRRTLTLVCIWWQN